MLNLGNITFGLSADTTGLGAAISNLQRFGNRVSSAVKAQKDGIDQATRALVRQENAMVKGLQSIQNMSERINRTKIAPEVKTDMISKLNDSYTAFVRRLNTRADRPLDILAFQRANLGFKESIDLVNRSLLNQTAAMKSAGTGGADAFQKQTIAIMKAQFEVERLITSLNRAASAGSMSPASATRLSGVAQGALAGYTSALTTSNPLGAVEMQQASIGLKRSLSLVKDELRSTHRAADPFIATFKGIGSAIELSSGPLNGFVFRIRAATELMSRYGLLIGGTVSAMVGLGVAFTSVAGSIIKTNMELERTEVMLKAVSGSSIQSSADMAFIREVSDKAGLSFQSTARDYARFSASALASGQSLKLVHSEFEKIAMAAGTMQLSVDDTRGVFRALEQIMSKGTVQSEELRGQLADRFPAAFTIAAKAVGVTTKQLGEMMKKGEVISREFVPAFLDAMTKFYNVDLSKPLETLAAGLNRLSNAWTFFMQALGTATNSQVIAKGVVNALTEGLIWLTANINQAIGVIGALVGALAGLAVAMAAPAIFAATGAIMNFFRALTLAKSATELLTAAQIGLNVAMMSNPIGAILGLLARLALAVGGAILGYNLLTRAVRNNQDVLGDLDGIEAYIDGQKRMGYQIRSTTELMIKQQQAKMLADTQQLGDAARGFNRSMALYRASASVAKVFKPAQGTADFFKAQAGAKAEELKILSDQVVARQKALIDLNKLLQLPEQPEGPNELLGGGGAGGGGKGSRSDGLARLRDLIAGAEEANAKMAILAKGPQDVRLIDDLFTARDALRELDTKQLSALDGLLKGAGYSAGSLEERLTGIVTTTRIASESVRQFARIWDELQEGSAELEHINRQLAFLGSGKDPRDLFMLDAIVDAKVRLKDMSEQGLEAVRIALMNLGVTAPTTEEALAKFYQSLDKGKEHVEAAKAVFEELRVKMQDLDDQSTLLMAAQQGANLEGLLDLDYLNQAMRTLDRLSKESFVAVGKALEKAGMAGTDAYERWASMLKMIDRNDEALERIRSTLEANKAAWVDWSTGVVDEIKGVLTGAQSLKDGLKNIFAKLADTILDVALFNPIKRSLETSITAVMEGRTSGYGTNDAAGGGSILKGVGNVLSNLFTSKGNTKNSADPLEKVSEAANLASRALGSDLTAASAKTVLQTLMQSSATTTNAIGLNAATTSLMLFTQAVYAASGSLGVSGGGGGGLLGTLFKVGSTLLGGGLGAVAGGGATYASGVMDLTNWVPGRASGGSLTKGQPYLINEPGTSGDLFIPGQSGWAVPNSQLSSQQQSVTIDASIGYIDARGATPDAVQMLKEEMAAREQRLRRELPYLVDQRYLDSRSRSRY